MQGVEEIYLGEAPVTDSVSNDGWSLPGVSEVLGIDFAGIEPALEIVPPSSTNATADLFPGERLQLTDEVLANIDRIGLPKARWYFGFSSLDLPLSTVTRLPQKSGECKTYPGDKQWPPTLFWMVFNLLLGGALIETVPLASMCYSGFNNANISRCSELADGWVTNSRLHIADPSSINSVLFQGSTCVPPVFAASNGTCSLGGYPAYTVAVTTVAQVQLAVNVARNANLRLVIKNTGHDFGAKSTGRGSLAIWTHKLKDIRFYESYNQDSYSGPAFKIGAGVQAFELYKAAKRHGVTVVAGEGETVGVAGGYLAGGGHSPLSSLYGIGADHVLSFEVVTADGRFVTASATSHPDLFWALRGGGGSTYGVVTSVVIKAYPKIPVAIMTFSFTTQPPSTITTTAFWAGVRAFFDNFPTYAAAGCYEYFDLFRTPDGHFMFLMKPWFAPNMTIPQLRTLASPLLARLEDLGIPVAPQYHSSDDFYGAWENAFSLEPYGSPYIRQASRLFPRRNWATKESLDKTFAAIRSVVEEGGYTLGFNFDPRGGKQTPVPADNAVTPAWRDTLLHLVMLTTWEADTPLEQVKAASDRITFDWMERWRAVSEGSGAYLSESDYIEPDFGRCFWGDKYPRLYELKRKWDPEGVFYAQNAVGSEDWKMEEMILGNLPSQNSRLCRV